MPSEQTANTAELIASPGRIAALLKRLLEEQPFLLVTFPELHTPYASALLTVDTDSNGLVLDELKPATGHHGVQAGATLQVHARLAGVDLYFDTEIATIELQDGIHLYHAALPDKLIYRQRREHVRVPLPQDAHIQLQHETRAAEARLLDLSSSGFGGVLLDECSLVADKRYTCTLTISTEIIRATAELRYLAEGPDRQRHFGALFHQPSPTVQRQIGRLVMQLQRDLVRT